eukprot:TRINITY_DN48518_c0_g1_i1.p1 TRINITY_DN48518_c0_g1~~TRINITY_DN48518_c0_g1_i1.p1  ORF type:complete len:223 (+),score=38.93 TRINITY_DN48518_c0_g1_i1:41-670(+)
MASQGVAVASMPQRAGCRHQGVTRNPIAAAAMGVLTVAMFGMVPALGWGACEVMSSSFLPPRLSGLRANLESHRRAVSMAAGIQLGSDSVGRLEQVANVSTAESLPPFEKPSWAKPRKTRKRGFAETKAARGTEDFKAARGFADSEEAIRLVLPIGSACPFRSDSPEVHAADEELPAVLTELLRIQEGEYAQISDSFAAGVEPDRSKAS